MFYAQSTNKVETCKAKLATERNDTDARAARVIVLSCVLPTHNTVSYLYRTIGLTIAEQCLTYTEQRILPTQNNVLRVCYLHRAMCITYTENCVLPTQNNVYYLHRAVSYLYSTM